MQIAGGHIDQRPQGRPDHHVQDQAQQCCLDDAHQQVHYRLGRKHLLELAERVETIEVELQGVRREQNPELHPTADQLRDNRHRGHQQGEGEKQHQTFDHHFFQRLRERQGQTRDRQQHQLLETLQAALGGEQGDFADSCQHQ